MKMKTSELIGPALDWAVAKCEGLKLIGIHAFVFDEAGFEKQFCPSEDWSQGGPILERDEINTYCYESPCWEAEGFSDGEKTRRYHARGSTPLIAAMRCYVASKLGYEVEIPEELCMYG